MIKWLFTPPTFDDADQTRTARLVYVLLLTILVSGVFNVSNVLFLIRPPDFFNALITLTSTIVVFPALFLLRQGQVRFSAILTCGTLWAVTTTSVIDHGTVAGLGYASYIVLIVITGFLVGIREAAIVLVLSALVGLGLVYTETQGITTVDRAAYPPFSLWLTNNIFFVVALVIQSLSTQGLNRMLGNLRQQKASLQQEIQERERVEAELVEINELLKAEIVERLQAEKDLTRFFEVSVDMMCVIDSEGRFKRVNPAFQRILGYASEEIIGQPETAFLHPEDREHTIIEAKQSMSDHRPVVNLKNRYLDKHGEVHWLSWSVSPTIDGLYCVSRDITRDIQNELIYELTLDMICIADAEGHLLQVNPAFERVLGYTESEMLNHTFLEFIHPDDHEHINSELDHLKSGQPSHGFRSRYICKDGSVKWLEWVVVPMHGLLYAVLRDVTESQRIDELRRELQVQKEVTRIKQTFVSQVSHQFRTPLTVILSSSELLRSRLDRMDEPRREKHFSRIESSIQRMLTMIDELLLIDRMSSNQLEVNYQSMDIVRFCEGLLNDIEPMLTPEHNLTFENPDDIRHIQSDPKLLRHMLENLLTNAVKYSPDGSNIMLKLWRCHDGGVAFQVSDQGMGIPEKEQQYIFDPFRRGKGTDAIQGTGLGLAIVMSSVNQHGGTVDVESTPGEGTTFTIKLPQLMER